MKPAMPPPSESRRKQLMPAKQEKFEPPVRVFQVKASGKELALVRALVVSRNGSWYTFRNFSGDGEWQENGMSWHETVIDALLAFPCRLVWQTVFACNDYHHLRGDGGKYNERLEQLTEQVQKLVIEAFEWGKLAALAEKTLADSAQATQKEKK
jgi:hypothetical protein